MLFRQIIAVYSENHTKLETFGVQDSDLQNVEVGGSCLPLGFKE
jgi:hypothetical protein